MISAEFRACMLANEINLNKIAQHFGITKKFTWEDPLTLKESSLKGLVKDPKDKAALVFHFGSVVFVNLPHHEIMDIINYLKRLEKNLNTLSPFEYTDDYRLTVTPGATLTIHDDSMVAPEEKEYYREIIATVLAKSVALEKIETEIDILFDDIEDVVDFLAQGHLNISDEKLARISAKILGFKYNTLSYIMLLDKPEITWTNAHAKELFTQLSDLFELVERYEKIGHKSQTLMDITEVFAGLAHNKRSTRLEWAVIILIGIEIVLSVIDMFLK